MAHENFSRDESVGGSSNRSFGLVFATVFAIAGLWPLAGNSEPRWWALASSAALLAIAFVAPQWLEWPNRAWTRFGVLLGRIVSPIVIAVLFYAVITPFGIAMRLVRKDPLRLEFDRDAASYWIERDPPGPVPEGMRDQF